MKSPSDATDFAAPTTATPPTQAQYMRRGFRDADKPTSAPSPSFPTTNTSEPFGALAQLPLSVQAAFRRKLVAIIALQLTFVTIGVAVLASTSPHWLRSAFVYSTEAAIVLGVALVALLVVLHLVRDKFPFNWLVLTLLSAALALAHAVSDVALDSHVVLLNCIFTLVFAVVLVLTAGWTQLTHAPGRSPFWCCGGMTVGWTPPTTGLLPFDESDDSVRRRELASPVLPGIVAFLVACGVLALVGATGLELSTTSGAALISFFVQLVVSFWFLFQVSSMHERLTPDAYMSGVVYFYADVLAVLAVLAVALLCVASCSGGGGDGSAACVGCFPWIETSGQGGDDDDREQV